MKTNRFIFVANVINFCSKNECFMEYDENPNSHSLDFIQINKHINGNAEWFGIYFHKKYIEFWVNDNNNDSKRYIYRCNEDECMLYIQQIICFGSEHFLKYNKNYTDLI